LAPTAKKCHARDPRVRRQDHPITGNPDADSGNGKAIDAHTAIPRSRGAAKWSAACIASWSADGKTLTVNNKGTHADGKAYDDTLVFDKQ